MNSNTNHSETINTNVSLYHCVYNIIMLMEKEIA